MKSKIIAIILCSVCILAEAQNIGVGTTSPVTPFHVATSANHVLTVENTNALNTGITTGINFSSGINSANTYKYTGAIRTIGTGTSEARLGIYTYAANNPSGLIERFTILDNGNVGIGNTNPLYTFSVSGNGYFSSYVGIQTTPNSSYALSVSGASRFINDLRVDGILNPNNALAIGNNTTIEGTLTVQSGKGIVRSVSTTQMKIKRTGVSFSATNLGAGSTIESGYLNFGEDFAAVTVLMGQAYNSTGDWAKVLVVPFEVDETNDRCRFTVTNVSSSAITFTSSYEVVLIGN